jgi:hypothetical protein
MIVKSMLKNALNRPEWLVLLLAAAAVGFQSFWPPAEGLANNGDFAKIAGQLDVGNPFDNQDVGRFADIQYFLRRCPGSRAALFSL